LRRGCDRFCPGADWAPSRSPVVRQCARESVDFGGLPWTVSSSGADAQRRVVEPEQRRGWDSNPRGACTPNGFPRRLRMLQFPGLFTSVRPCVRQSQSSCVRLRGSRGDHLSFSANSSSPRNSETVDPSSLDELRKLSAAHPVDLAFRTLVSSVYLVFSPLLWLLVPGRRSEEGKKQRRARPAPATFPIGLRHIRLLAGFGHSSPTCADG